MSAIGLIGILVAMVLFLVMVYKNCVSYWVAILCAIIVALTSQLNLLDALFSLEQDSFLNGSAAHHVQGRLHGRHHR